MIFYLRRFYSRRLRFLYGFLMKNFKVFHHSAEKSMYNILRRLRRLTACTAYFPLYRVAFPCRTGSVWQAAARLRKISLCGKKFAAQPAYP